MIQKLDKFDSTEASIYHVEKLYAAVNQLVDAVNKLETMVKNTNTVLESLVEENNRHEDIIRQIGEWGSSKGECLWCETLTEFNPKKPQKETFISIDEALKNAEKMISTLNRYYLYVKYKHLIGKLCKFKWGQGCYYGILTNIKRKPTELPFESNGRAFSNCEPVKPDDDIIYKGE